MILKLESSFIHTYNYHCAVPPVYYAHLAASRGRSYQGNFGDGSSIRETTPGDELPEFLQVPKIHENVSEVMFYCWIRGGGLNYYRLCSETWPPGSPFVYSELWLVRLIALAQNFANVGLKVLDTKIQMSPVVHVPVRYHGYVWCLAFSFCGCL